MIDFNINNIGINIQIIPVYGLATGILYYNPNLEPEPDNVPEDEFFEQVTILLLFFGIHITWWKL